MKFNKYKGWNKSKIIECVGANSTGTIHIIPSIAIIPNRNDVGIHFNFLGVHCWVSFRKFLRRSKQRAGWDIDY
jgi:hypothetical protein